MKVIPKKGGAAHDKGGDPKPVSYPWEAAMSALGSGAYDVHGNLKEEDRGPDMPGAQSPAPGVDPVGGKESAAPGDVLTNVSRSPIIASDELDEDDSQPQAAKDDKPKPQPTSATKADQK